MKKNCKDLKDNAYTVNVCKSSNLLVTNAYLKLLVIIWNIL